MKVRKAFTLIEIMAAAAIMTVVFTVVLSVASRVLTTWNRTSGEVRASYEAKVLLKMLQDDFEAMALKRTGGAWLQVSYDERVGMLSGGDYMAHVPLKPPQISFFSHTMARPRYSVEGYTQGTYERTPIPGTLCAIKYRMGLKNPFLESAANPGENEKQYNAFYGLYRSVIDAETTFESVLGPMNQGTDEDTAMDALSTFWIQNPVQVIDERGYKSPVDLSIWTLSPENMLAMNVVDLRLTFGVKYMDYTKPQGEDPLSHAQIPPGVPFTIADRIMIDTENMGGNVSFDVSSQEALESGSLAYVDVSLTMLTDLGAREIKARMQDNTLTPDTFRELCSQHSVTVARRINFISERL